ncbi:glycosyltransferase family 1 protein [Emticicia sp. BO119]|uniref:glycosyltransferase family protein n=1 Tax=Emticicia sp. BO119 TaxID=2757768 RepID=UPI0015EFE088|nr:glycosyltransferase family 1 protein [Emticicia sp. BO119]MBA4849306.1 glycosyltransferase family 1 protein [Emticicia sp. BO119]
MKSFDTEEYSFPHDKQIVEVHEDDNIDTLVCFSPIKWESVFQRPQHLMSHASKKWRVFYIEDPIFGVTTPEPELNIKELKKYKNLFVVSVRLPAELSASETIKTMESLLAKLCNDYKIENFGTWYYSIKSIRYTARLYPRVVIYDCINLIRNTQPALIDTENELISQTDLVFTNGKTIYDEKQNWHPQVYNFPSSIDKEHFMQARIELPEPSDQEEILFPRLGLYGAIDECLDIELLRALAARRPDWQFVLLGPIIGIDEDTLPKAENIHYLGEKPYQVLPSYISGWNAALLLVLTSKARQAHVPTRTPEYLAAFKPIVSTSVPDIISPYEAMGLVSTAENVFEFEAAIEEALSYNKRKEWKKTIDDFLKSHSWDVTWQQMRHLIKTNIIA